VIYIEIRAIHSISRTSSRERKNCLIWGILIELKHMFKISFLNKPSTTTKRAPRKDAQFKLLVGLGNPGEQYGNTFHNVGLMFVDFLAKETGSIAKTYRDFEFFKIDKTIIVRPDEFMNRSGLPVKLALKYFGLQPEDLIVVHDDSDLLLGQYKISRGRGSAGHKGIESIFKELRTDKFTRVRIGVRRQIDGYNQPRRRAGDFVLSRIGRAEVTVLSRLFSEIKAFYFKAE
jgi:PTH1 family peptidyl-tRNA hydrolase